VCARMPRKRVLIGLMVLFTVGNLASALAPGYDTLLAARFLAGLPHGAFFGVGAVVAARIGGEARGARSVARMFLGLTLANVLGVPAATLLGQHLGWRATFGVVAVIGLVAAAALAALVPDLPAHGPAAGLRREAGALRDRQVWLGLLTTVFGFAGVFAVYSYLAAMLTRVTGVTDTTVTVVLALFGVGMTLGALIAGSLTDRAPRLTLYTSLAALAVVLVLFPFAARHTATALVAVVLLGLAGFATTTPLQMMVMRKASHAPTLASAANQAAFNLANAGGAWAGGVAIASGWGWTSPAFVGAALTLTGLAVALTAGRLDRASASAPVRSRVIAFVVREQDREAA
jgi:DHA1 family inner membrane transport protein